MGQASSKTTLGARIVLGLIFTVFGLNGFFNFIPMPPPSGPAGEFMGALLATGYFFPLLKATEVLVGVALLSGRFVALALTVLAPISVNILALHVFLAPEGMPMALLIVLLQGFLAWRYRDAYRGLFSQPSQQDTSTVGRTAASADAS